MHLPPINIRQSIYKFSAVGIALATLLGSLGVIPLPVAGAIGTFLGVLGNALADTASAQQRKDGTLVLTGPVEKQVTDGINILAEQAADTVTGINKVNDALAQANRVRDEVIGVVRGTPVVGPLASEALDRILNHK